MIPSVEFEQCKVHQKMENVSTNHQLALLGFKEIERKEKHKMNDHTCFYFIEIQSFYQKFVLLNYSILQYTL